jgi:hypothetical protein
VKKLIHLLYEWAGHIALLFVLLVCLELMFSAIRSHTPEPVPEPPSEPEFRRYPVPKGAAWLELDTQTLEATWHLDPEAYLP